MGNKNESESWPVPQQEESHHYVPSIINKNITYQKDG
jgi:hypothetical protein